jgi:hypothetical protein
MSALDYEPNELVDDNEPQTTTREEVDDTTDDGCHNERDDIMIGEKNKRISEKDAFALTLRDMVEITPINRKLFKAVQDAVYQIETNAKLDASVSSSSLSPTSRKKEKAPVKNKATQIREDAQRQREDKRVEDLRASAVNTVLAVNRTRIPTISQIIQWLRTANEIPAYIAMIGGAILAKLAENDDVNLSIEIYQYWIDSLNTMKAEIESCKSKTGKSVLTPLAKLYKDIQKQNMAAWTSVMRKFEYQLRKTVNVTDSSSWIQYQLREVEGIHPNTLYDIATYRAELTPWQLELLELLWRLAVRSDISKDGGLLVHSTTTSGKTTLTLFVIDYFIKAGQSVICLFPNEMLAMQCAALIQQTTKASISVYTENLALNNPNAQVHIIVPGYQPEDFAITDRMTLIMDECHVIKESYYAKYLELVEMLAPHIQTIVGLSATLSDVASFIAYLKKTFRTEFKVTGTTNRPVRMRLFDGAGTPLHPWARQDTVRGTGLAGPDVAAAIATMSSSSIQIPEMLANTPIPRKLMLQETDVDRIDTATLESYETNMLSILADDEGFAKKCFPNSYESDPSIKNLYALLQRVSKDGNVLVFCEDPNEVFQLLAKESNRQLIDTVPFWNELLTVNREFVARIGKLRTPKYIAALENLEEMNAKGVKIKDASLRDIVSGVRKEIERLYGERKTQLNSLHACWKDIPTASIIKEQADLEIESISDNYQPCRHLAFGNYSFMEIGSVRKLYPGMGESHCRAVTNGIALLDDFSDLPTRISIMRTMAERRFSILISGRKTLALGVNMSVRSTLIYDPADMFLPSELKQMSERSGRKGLDRTGYTTIIRKTAP